MQLKETQKFRIENEKIGQRKVTSEGHYRDLEAKNKRNIFGRFLFWFCFLAWLGVLVYVIFFSGFMEIKEVRISGNQFLESGAIQSKINERLSGKYFNLISKNNYLFIRGGRTGKILTESFKRIKQVELQKKFPSSVFINITERTTSLILCSSGSCYYIDEEGTAWQSVDFNSREFLENEFIVINERSGQAIPQGEQVIAKDFIDFTLALENLINEKKLADIKRETQVPSLIAGTIEFATGQDWKLMFSNEWSAPEQISALENVLAKKIGDRRNELEYIDLRVKNKVFFKFRGSEEKQEEDKEEKSEEEKD